MSKELYTELHAAFEELKKSEAKKMYDAVENKEFIPIPFTLPVVIKTLKETLEKHAITREEYQSAVSMISDSLSADEMKILNDTYDSLKKKE